MINGVMTVREASERWGLKPITINQACTGQKGYPPRFRDGEYQKSGGIWLVTQAGMERLYGKERQPGETRRRVLPRMGSLGRKTAVVGEAANARETAESSEAAF